MKEKYSKLKEYIAKAINLLKEISFKEPLQIRVEELEGNRIVLSFEYMRNNWDTVRLYKEFKIQKGKIISMTNFKN